MNQNSSDNVSPKPNKEEGRKQLIPLTSSYNMSQVLIFTDLDGTLLDHFNYDFSAANDALNSLKMLGIACILNTSKTYSELLALRKALQHKDPFIVENGAAIYFPHTFHVTEALPTHGDFKVKAFGPNRTDLIALAQSLQARYDFTAYHQLSAEQLAEYTGLDIDNAQLSLEREFTEPLIWHDSNKALNQLREELEPLGVKLQKGGRFVHLMGALCDKAIAMNWLKTTHQETIKSTVKSMALGDGENDVGMIQQADIGVVVRSPVHLPPEIPNRSDIWITDSYGPKGWSEAINQALRNEGYV